VVKIRLKRTGRTKQPYYRIEVFDQRRPRDGRSIEKVGSYDPRAETPEQKLRLNPGRIHYWLDHGAQPSESVASLLKKHGIYTG